MWSAKARADDNIEAYNRLDHAVPLPGLFHAQMHVIEAIVKAHWGEEARETSRLITAHYDTLVEGLDEWLSEAGFLRLMDFLRTVFLQDAALLRRSYPDHEIFKDGLFR
jgi:Centromere DNA-binding protein complex CBF3 subunit, domain 2